MGQDGVAHRPLLQLLPLMWRGSPVPGGCRRDLQLHAEHDRTRHMHGVQNSEVAWQADAAVAAQATCRPSPLPQPRPTRTQGLAGCMGVWVFGFRPGVVLNGGARVAAGGGVRLYRQQPQLTTTAVMVGCMHEKATRAGGAAQTCAASGRAFACTQHAGDVADAASAAAAGAMAWAGREQGCAGGRGPPHQGLSACGICEAALQRARHTKGAHEAAGLCGHHHIHLWGRAKRPAQVAPSSPRGHGRQANCCITQRIAGSDARVARLAGSLLRTHKVKWTWLAGARVCLGRGAQRERA